MSFTLGLKDNMNKSVSVTTKTAKLKIAPIGFLEFGKDSYNAFCAYKPDRKYSPSSYYLICRAIELSFKAYLLAKGMDRKKLKSKSLGHNLCSIFRKSKELQIGSVVSFTDKEIVNLKIANSWYADKGFEYFQLRNLIRDDEKLPNVEVLKGMVEKLFEKLQPVCIEAAKD